MKFTPLKYFLLVLLAVCAFRSPLQAQDTPSFKSVEDLTYHHYVNQQWDSVITTAKAGLHNDIDYYYLRVRMGIAYFNKGNYCKAIRHLNKATGFNSDDSTALEYLYYSYKYFNRYLYQTRVIKSFRPETRKRILDKTPILRNGFYTEMGYQHDQAFKKSNETILGGGIYGEIDYPVSFNFFGMNYRHYFKGVSINAMYEYFNSQRLKKSVSPTAFREEKYNVVENHFYPNTQISSSNKLTIVPAVHYQMMKYSNNYMTMNPVDSVYSLPVSDTTRNNFIASLGFYKDVDVFSLGLTASYSNLYKKNIFQGALLFTWFPFGNMKLYTTTTLAWVQMPGSGRGMGKGKGNNHPAETTTLGDKSHAVFEEVVGGKIANRLWLEGQFSFNGLRGYNKANSMVVFNNPEQVNYLAGLVGVFELTNSLELSIGYQFAQKEISGIYYTAPQESNTKYYLNNSHTIYGGLKWKL